MIEPSTFELLKQTLIMNPELIVNDEKITNDLFEHILFFSNNKQTLIVLNMIGKFII